MSLPATTGGLLAPIIVRPPAADFPDKAEPQEFPIPVHLSHFPPGPHYSVGVIRTNYHTHNELCDGTGRMEEYVEAAISKGFTALGFSSHAPLPVTNVWTLDEEKLAIYLAEADRLKAVYADRLQVYKGLEIDYIPGSQTPKDAKYRAMNLDFAAASVHSTVGLDQDPEYRCIDGPIENLRWLLDNIHGGSWENLSETYFTRVTELIRIGGFAFLGHLDLIKKRNRNGDWFNENATWYRRQVVDTLDVLSGSGIIMEINSGAISRGALDEVYPSPWIIAEARKRHIAVMVNADAHRTEDIDCHFDESRAILRDIGSRETWALLDGEWTAVPL